MSDKHLAAAVVMQAILDFKAEEPAKRNTRGVSVHWSNWRRDRDEAELFLFSDSGAWAASREAWCYLAGIDPDALVAEAKAGFPRYFNSDGRARKAAVV